MASGYPYPPRRRNDGMLYDDAELYPPSTNPAAASAIYQQDSFYNNPPASTGGFPGGVQAYPAYPVAQPAYIAQPQQQYVSYGGYGAPPPQPPPPRHQHHQRPPPNHAAGPNYFPKPPAHAATTPAGAARGGGGAAQYDVEAGGFGPQRVTEFTKKAEQQMRMAFVRKVYSILCLQLLGSAAFCAYLMYDSAANEYVLTHPGLYITAIVASVVVLLMLMCYRTSYPVNLGLLFIWTGIEAFTIGVVTASFARAGEGDIVIQALGITFVVFFALTIFTFQSKWDFTFLGGILFASTWVLIIWGFVGAIFGFQPGFVYALLGAIIFSLYICFDTLRIVPLCCLYMLMEKLPYDEWVLGAISLYLDIINLFLFLLQMLAESQRRQEERR